MNELENLVMKGDVYVQCCDCKKYKTIEGWKDYSLDLTPATHTYCEPCFDNAMVQFERDKQNEFELQGKIYREH